MYLRLATNLLILIGESKLLSSLKMRLKTQKSRSYIHLKDYIDWRFIITYD